MTAATPPLTTQPAAPFRLVTDDRRAAWFRSRFKRAPNTLADLAMCEETMRHERRLAELKAMAPKLALLDALAPALAARGVNLSHREFLRRDVVGCGVVLRLLGFALDADDKLHAALLAVGFRQVGERHRFSSLDEVTLKHGRALYLCIDVSPAATPAPPPTQPIAEETDASRT